MMKIFGIFTKFSKFLGFLRNFLENYVTNSFDTAIYRKILQKLYPRISLNLRRIYILFFQTTKLTQHVPVIMYTEKSIKYLKHFRKQFLEFSFISLKSQRSLDQNGLWWGRGHICPLYFFQPPDPHFRLKVTLLIKYGNQL